MIAPCNLVMTYDCFLCVYFRGEAAMVMLDGDAGGSDGDAGGATNSALNQLLIQIMTVFCVFIIISIKKYWALIWSCWMCNHFL